MTSPTPTTTANKPPNKHQLALMIWLSAFPTLVILNLALGHVLRPASPVLRNFVLVTLAVPIVNYALMPTFLRIRKLLVSRRGALTRHERSITRQLQDRRPQVQVQPRSG
jgi:antibiotic biosynthesis monooxygenase (ABM) superfamily enzyme